MLFLPTFENPNNVDFFLDKDLINANLDDFLDGLAEISTKNQDRSFLKDTVCGSLIHQYGESRILDSKEMLNEYIHHILKKGKVLEEA